MMMPRSSSLLGATCVVWLAGCGSGASSSEREPQATGQTLLADDTVLVTSTTRFYTSVGIAERVEDLSASPPEIYTHDGVRFSRNTGSAVPGGWRFTGVPRGEYYLRADRINMTDILTSARHVDIGINRLGRPDAVYTDVDWFPLQLDLRNLSPWVPWTGDYQQGSSFQVVSSEVDMLGELALFEAVPEGATSLVTNEAGLLSYLWTNIPVFQADRGDRLYVNQFSEFIAGRTSDGTLVGYSSLTRSVRLAPFDLVPSWEEPLPLPISTELQPVDEREVSFDWRLSEFARMAPEVHPRAVPRGSSFAVRPAPHGPADGWVGYAGELLWMNMPQGTASDFPTRLRFGNPYPSNWGVVGSVSTLYFSPTQLPSNPARFINLASSYTATEAIEDLTAGPVIPKVSPPRSFRIDRKPASDPQRVSSLNPMISWVPPAVGKPTAYEVKVRQYLPEFGAMLDLGSIYVPGSVRDVRLPPGKLEPGAECYVTVTAVYAPLWDVEHAPFSTRDTVPYHSAGAFSSFFTVP
ncbi:hypothetical protein HUA74_30585 [Myxococcus sp. CA051A]|uniref:hypothetical protein n=1 Tax=unclassified Myxococcus TaxID=2648731 RepID=UPI00157A482A|nr:MULTISPECIES: hypothetical protein [unclassified Myxococcus]NTX35037.1 hypothetical protein [Myxococcus sp. CA033]NTX65011.1 hypothetical protein [Myxococcus sp. CA051A]